VSSLRKKTKFFLFFLIFSVSCSGFFIFLTPNTQAYTPEESISRALLERINVYLSEGSGMFDSYWGYEKDVYEITDIYHLPNPININEDSAEFETHITVNMQIRHFTDYGKDNVYWNARSETQEYLWLECIYADDWFWTSAKNRIHDKYVVEYQDYEFYPRSILEPSNYIKAKGYDGKFDLTVDFDRFEDAYAIVNDVDETEVSISTLEIYPTKATVLEANSHISGNYTDYFSDTKGTTITVLDYTTQRPAVNSYEEMDGTVQSRVRALMADEIIGVYAIDGKPASFTDGYQGTLGYQGNEWVYRGDLTRKEPNVFELPTVNRPRVEIYEQQIKRGNCMMAFDTEGLGAGFKDGTPIINYFGTADTPFRQVGWHITEHVHTQTIQVQFVAKALLQADPVTLDRLLEEPLIRRGDVVWNIAFTGNTDASIFIDSGFLQKLWERIFNSSIFAWIVVGIIIVGVGFVGYKAYTSPIVQRKIGAKMALESRNPKQKKVKNVKRNKGKLKKALQNLKPKKK